MKRIVFTHFSDLLFNLKGYEPLEKYVFDWFGNHSEFYSSLHGIPHWLSVYDNASKLLELETNNIYSDQHIVLTSIAAYLHDAGRLINNDGIYADKHHSDRSKEFIQENLGNTDLGLTTNDIEWIALLARSHYLAGDQHSFKKDLWQKASMNRMEICVKIVRDADALDRIRFNGLDTSFLHLESSHSLVDYVTKKWSGGYRFDDLL